MKEKVLISTGGSGGHVIPAITIHEHLKETYDVIISTDSRGLKYLEKDDCRSILIDTPKLNSLILFPFTIFKVLLLTINSLKILKKEKISYLISTGGYMSLPLCLAAKILNIKIFLIEPNMVLGRANKFFLNFSKKLICYSINLKNYPKKFIAEKFSEDLRTIEETVIDRFSSTIKAVENMDENLADELIASYRDDLGKISDKLVAASISGDVEIGKENKTASVALYARYLKRIGAHLKNKHYPEYKGLLKVEVKKK